MIADHPTARESFFRHHLLCSRCQQDEFGLCPIGMANLRNYAQSFVHSETVTDSELRILNQIQMKPFAKLLIDHVQRIKTFRRN